MTEDVKTEPLFRVRCWPSNTTSALLEIPVGEIALLMGTVAGDEKPENLLRAIRNGAIEIALCMARSDTGYYRFDVVDINQYQIVSIGSGL